MGNDWQTVPSAKDKRKRPESSISATDARSSVLGGATDPAGETSARNNPERKTLQQEAAVQQRGQPLRANGHTLLTAQGAFDHLLVDDTPPSTPRREEPPVSKAPAENGSEERSEETAASPERKLPKPKKPKVKKVTTSQAAAQITLSDIAQTLQTAEENYKADHRNQLEYVAQYLRNAFQECDIPFNKTVLEQPLSKSANVPVQDLPDDIASALSDFLAAKDVGAVEHVTSDLLTVVFEGVPQSASSKVQPPRAKVGLLILLSLILRTRPEVLLLLSPVMLRNAQSFSSSRRLPFQLWIIHQVTESDIAIAVGVWTRVLLPQLLGQPLPSLAAQKPPNDPGIPRLSSSAANAILTYLEDTLASVRQGSVDSQRLGPVAGDPKGLWALKVSKTALLQAAQQGIEVQVGAPAGKASAVEPVVPPAAIDAIVRACFATEPSFGPTLARIKLLQQYGELRELHLGAVASGVTQPQTAVRLALETAAIGAESSSQQPNEIVEQAAMNLIDLFHVDPRGTASAWEGRHKQQLRGSTAVLQALSSISSLQQLLRNPAKREAFMSLLGQLRDRNKSLLSGGKAKGWQQSSARAADNACAALSKRQIRKQRGNAAANVFLFSSFLAIIIIFLSRQPGVQDAWENLRRTPTGQKIDSAVHSSLEWLQVVSAARSQQLGGSVSQFYQDRLAPLAKELWQRSSEELSKAGPLAQQAWAQAGPIFHSWSAKIGGLLRN